MALFLLGFIFATRALAFSDLNTTRVGPASWLDPLSNDEIQQIRDECYFTRSSQPSSHAIKDSIGLEERIYGGELTPPGVHKSAVAFPKRYSFVCGGTLVSRRHIITAAHCINGLSSVLVGGVCRQRGEECPERDMLELEIDVTMSDWDQQIRGHFKGDFGIVQLKRIKALDEAWASGRLDIDCLPAIGVPIDGDIILRGWGESPGVSISETAHLKNATVWSTSAAYERGIDGVYGLDCLDSDRPTFCLFRPINKSAGLGGGDSGGGAVKWNATNGHHTLYGVINGAHLANYTERGQPVRREIMIQAKTDSYLKDLCHHLGLCAPGVDREAITLHDLRMELPTNIEFTPSRRRGDFPALEPFKLLSPVEAEAIRKQCSLPSDYSQRPIEQRGYSFAGFVASENENGAVQMLCTATLITLRQAITSRQCVVTAKDASTGSAQWGLALGESCWRNSTTAKVSNCPLLPIEFIAWNSNFSIRRLDLALLQLKEPVSEELIHSELISVACVKNESFYHTEFLARRQIDDYRTAFIVRYYFHYYHAFGWTKGDDNSLAIRVKPQGDSLYPPQGPLTETIVYTYGERPPPPPPGTVGLRPLIDYDCFEEKLICMLDVSKAAEPNGGMEPGWGLHDRLSDGKMVGLFVEQLDKEAKFDEEKVRVNAYLDMHLYLADFCVYLNLCYAPDQTYYELMIPYFDRFLHF